MTAERRLSSQAEERSENLEGVQGGTFDDVVTVNGRIDRQKIVDLPLAGVPQITSLPLVISLTPRQICWLEAKLTCWATFSDGNDFPRPDCIAGPEVMSEPLGTLDHHHAERHVGDDSIPKQGNSRRTRAQRGIH